MELPDYHWPTVGSVVRSTWERGRSFIIKAGTIILLSTIVIWFTSSYGWVGGRIARVEDLNEGFLASLGQIIAPLFAPLGWGQWRPTVAAITGLVAKENVVGSFGILYGFAEVAEEGQEIWQLLALDLSMLAGFSFLVFNLLCAPCFAAIGAMRRELGRVGWTLFAVAYQTGLAYAVSLVIYQMGRWFTGSGFGVGTAVAVALVLGFVYLLIRPEPKSQTSGLGSAVRSAGG